MNAKENKSENQSILIVCVIVIELRLSVCFVIIQLIGLSSNLTKSIQSQCEYSFKMITDYSF